LAIYVFAIKTLFMKKIFLVTALFLLLLQLYAQNTKYEISFPNIKHHEAVITLTVTSIKENQPAVFRMSRSSPGRYATHEFGKNIYNVIAFDKSDHLIQINRIDADIYEVPKHSGFVKVQYTLFGNYADGTYDGIDENSVHLNMPATFMWMKGMEKDSSLIEVRFNIPSGKKWSIATQLKPGNDPFTFTAPGLQYFMDSPTKIGELSFNKWTIQNNNGIIYQFTLA
jgi:predicted metalloprotease with PDZ domain